MKQNKRKIQVISKDFIERLRKEADMLQAATDEPPFTAEDLTLLLEPLIGEYFICEYKIKGSEISIDFFNGQIFSLNLEEIK